MNAMKRAFTGWKTWEICWMLLVVAVTVGVSLYLGDNFMGIISAVTGILYVIFAGKGKLLAYGFGLVNCVLYAIISFQAKLYGETMLNALYYVPMQFVGFFMWKKHMNANTGEVEKRHMKQMERLACLLLIAALTLGYGCLLHNLGDALPFMDSFTTMASVVAMILSVKRYAEQWWIWFFVNGVSIYMWFLRYLAGAESAATIVMWIAFWLNGIIILVKWEKALQKPKQKNEVKPCIKK